MFIQTENLVDTIMNYLYSNFGNYFCHFIVFYGILLKTFNDKKKYQLQKNCDFSNFTILKRDFSLDESFTINKIQDIWVLQFINEFLKKIKGMKKEELLKRLKNVTIVQQNKLDSLNFTLKNKNKRFSAFYDTLNNNIVVFPSRSKNYKNVIFHELLHTITTFYEKRRLLSVGFCQKKKNNKKIGTGLNEGYTEVITNRLVGNTSDSSYKVEQRISLLLERIMGENLMINCYFNSDLYGLVEKMKQYKDEKEIIRFLQLLDFYTENYTPYATDDNDVLLRINIFDELLDFLCDLYIKKVIIDKNTSKVEFNSFMDFLKKPIELRKLNYVYDDKRIMEIINKNKSDGVRRNGSVF